jgi:hypothetical protein
MGRSAIDEASMLVLDTSSAADADSLVGPAAHRLVLLTGQSAPSNTALSPQQIAFLHAVAPPGVEILAHGFPFLRSHETDIYREPWLVVAAVNNARQYLAARFSRRFQDKIVVRLDELFAKTEETLLIITGSCGLRLLDAAWPRLTRGGPPFHVIALGPASDGRLRIPQGNLTTVQGARDGWSAMLFHGAIDHRVPGGHLDYWTCDPTIALVRSLLASTLASLRDR